MIAVEIIQEDLMYQKMPTLRIHKPNNLSVGGFHRDSDYNHPEGETNVWVPLTSALESSTIWIEKDYKKENYFPFNATYGEYAMFNGQLKHGNKKNNEGFTRVSFDFRIIRSRLFRENNKRLLDRGAKFSIGHYYCLLRL